MAQPLQKGFGNWLGVALKEFEDFEFADGNGRPRVLSRKLMAEYLECDPATIGNYIGGNTIPGSDKVPLFFANFPAEVRRYVDNYFWSLQPDARQAQWPSVAELTARIVSSVAEINEAAAQLPASGTSEESLRDAMLRCTAKVQAQLDELNQAMRRPDQAADGHRMRVAQ